MAVGPLTSNRFPYLPLRLSLADQIHELEALLDTGFDGDLAVPPELIADGPLPDEYRSWLLADGSTIVAPVYYGTVTVGTFTPRPADIAGIGDEPLVGRGVSDHYRITLDHGERVLIEP